MLQGHARFEPQRFGGDVVRRFGVGLGEGSEPFEDQVGLIVGADGDAPQLGERAVEPFEHQALVGRRDQEPQERDVEGQGEGDDLLHCEHPPAV